MTTVNQSRVCILRGAGQRPSWQTVCADCGPLDLTGSQATAVDAGREHLQRTHGGGQMAIGLGPYRDVEAAVGRELELALDAMAEWYAGVDRSSLIPAELDRLCQAVLSVSGRSSPGETLPPAAS